MKKTLPLFTVLLCAVIISCKKDTETTVTKAEKTAKNYALLKNADWFLGSWGNSSAEGSMTERWQQVNDSVYNGECYFVVGKDTVFAETVVLEQANGKLAYTVSVPGQNEEKPVRFEMTSGTAKQMIFENPAHDFPNKIVYNHASDDSLVAEIFGTKNGKPASQKFIMTRQK